MRVAYIVHGFGVGGIERCVAHLANHLDRERFQPLIIALTRNGAAADWIERDDVPIVEINKRTTNDPMVVLGLARVLREYNVDIVHSHNWGTLIETSVARRWAGVPCHVHTEHGQGLHERVGSLKGRLRRQATYWAFNRADAVVVCAESVRPLVTARSGFPESRIRFLPNGVEDPLERPINVQPTELRRQLGISEEALIVGSIGRVVDVKDFPTAVAAIGLLQNERVSVHLVIVGDGPNVKPLQDRIRDLGLTDRVHLVGWHTNIADWLRLFDVYINCSRSEAMSMGILEAMAAGLPIVATDVGDNRYLVAGDNPCGITVGKENPAGLADALAEILRNNVGRRQYAEAARRRYEETYTTARMSQRHEMLYERLLDHHRSVNVPRLRRQQEAIG
jgi:glycosyltransferase involved in cell wall biosynthesis